MNLERFMPQFMHQRNEDKIVLDLGSNYIKALSVKGNVVDQWLIKRRTPHYIEDITDWLKNNFLTNNPLKIAVKGNSTLVRYIAFPKMDTAKIKEAFNYEISKYIPFAKEEIYFDLFVVDPDYSAKECLVLLAVAKKDFIDSIIKQFTAAKLNIASINLGIIALLNLLLIKPHKEENNAIVDIGSNSTIINLVRQGVPYLNREIKISAQDYFNKIAKAKGLEAGQRQEFTEKLNNLDKDLEAATFNEVLEESSNDFAEGIKENLDYFEVNWGEKIQHIFITGGLTKIEPIASMIGKDLGISVENWDVFDYSPLTIPTDLKKYRQVLAVSLGLTAE